jgi:hypothetical protein
VHTPADWTLARGPLEFWDAAVSADDSQREAMWRHAKDLQIEWRLALLQSLPDYRRYDPTAARSGLQSVIDAFPGDDIAAVARIALYDLRGNRACESRVAELKERLVKVIAIEERLENDGH